MVIKFQSSALDPPVLLYMGVDKVENEDLIRWGWPEDVWFHVDKLSSAHVYVRLPEGMSWEAMPEALITDCAQLVKANSIEGNKQNNIEVVYTPWENLKKSGDMAVGQVGFHSERKVKHVKVEKRINEIVNRLNKTMRKGDIDYRGEREARDTKERQKKRAVEKAQRDKEKKEAEEAERLRRQRNYEDVEETNVTSNVDAGNLSDEFM